MYFYNTSGSIFGCGCGNTVDVTRGRRLCSNVTSEFGNRGRRLPTTLGLGFYGKSIDYYNYYNNYNYVDYIHVHVYVHNNIHVHVHVCGSTCSHVYTLYTRLNVVFI